MPDPLDDFLDQDFSCHPPDDLQNAVRRQTVRVLRTRRWTRRIGIAAAAAACYVAGLTTMWLVPPRVVEIHHQLPAPPPLIVERIVQPPPVEEKPRESALAYEWKAHDEPQNRAANFFKAGDLYLNQENDAEGALRCYRQALDIGGLPVLEESPDDTWLVSALKNARRKERIHDE